MLTYRSGRSLSTANTALLWCNVVSNIYNLIIISLIDKSDIRVLLGDHSDAKQIIVMIQTVVMICAIMISTVQKTSGLIFSIKFWVFKLILILLIVDIMQAYITAADLLSREIPLDEFWKIKTHSKEPVDSDKLYLIIAVVFTIYLVFKFCVTYTVFFIAKKFHSDLFNGEYFLDQDVERNTPSERIISSELPPSYNQCVTEDTSTPPPPYNVVQKL